jgi:hypothetical protein
MKTIIYKPVQHVNTDDLPYLIQDDILGKDFEDDHDDIYEGNTNRVNDPIKIDDLIMMLVDLKTLGANYVSIDYHTDHREYELDGQEVRLATQEEIDEHIRKDKQYQIDTINLRLRDLAEQTKVFNRKLNSLTGE